MNDSGRTTMRAKKLACILAAILLPAIIVLSFTVPAFGLAGTIAVTPAIGPPNSITTITGASFTPGNIYSVYWDGSTLLATGTNVAGGFTATVSVPVSYAGNHTISVTSTGDTSTPQLFTVTPNLLASTYSVKVGDTVTVYGTGFTASTSVNVTIDATSITSAYSDTTGSFNASFTVPSIAAGAHTVTATDSLGQTYPVSITVSPKITLSSSTGVVGSVTTITGNGFQANNTVTLRLDTSTTLGTVGTTNTGVFTYNMTIPGIAAGAHTITATDTFSNNSSATYTVSASLSINPTSIVNGGTIALTGSGFVAASTITVLIDGTATGTSATADASGKLAVASFNVPTLPGGSHTVKAIDTSSNFATATLTIKPTMAFTPTSGQGGTVVQVTGNGFAATAIMTLTYDGTRLTTTPAGFTADTSGNISVSFTVPASAGGTHVINATDGANSASGNYTVTSSINPGSTSGKVGATGSVTGSGFGARANVSLKFDANTLTSAAADATGNVTINFTVPISAFGNHTITVSDNTNSKSFAYSVQAAATITPAAGDVGTQISVAGTGFNASTPVTIDYDTTKVGNTTVPTDANGSFSVAFSAPASKGGTHVISVTDGTNTITNNFAMDSTPPPIPDNLTPPNATKAPALAVFTWTSVTDPSGVTYEFELAPNAQFSTPLFDETNLTSPNFTIVQANKLKSVSRNHPYYWRVRAIDGASNASEWSTATFIFVGFTMPVAGWVGIAVLAIILSGIGGFFLGAGAHKPAVKKPEPPKPEQGPGPG